MATPEIISILVKTEPAPNDDSDTLGYELLHVRNQYEAPIIQQALPDPNASGNRFTLVSSGRVFPESVQAAMKPYFERAGISHSLNPKSANPVSEKEVRVTVEDASGDRYQVQKLPNGDYYASHDGRPVTPPRPVIQEVQTVLQNYQP